jgi:hypothetical protein
MDDVRRQQTAERPVASKDKRAVQLERRRVAQLVSTRLKLDALFARLSLWLLQDSDDDVAPSKKFRGGPGGANGNGGGGHGGGGGEDDEDDEAAEAVTYKPTIDLSVGGDAAWKRPPLQPLNPATEPISQQQRAAQTREEPAAATAAAPSSTCRCDSDMHCLLLLLLLLALPFAQPCS